MSRRTPLWTLNGLSETITSAWLARMESKPTHRELRALGTVSGWPTSGAYHVCGIGGAHLGVIRKIQYIVMDWNFEMPDNAK